MGRSKGKGKVRLPSADDGMAEDLRAAIRAKHRLVEEMKDVVKDEVDVDERHEGQVSGSITRFPLWKIVVTICVIFVCITLLSGASAAEKATRQMRLRYAQRRALENEEKTKWRSERVLRHFGLRRMSQVRFTEEIYTGDDLFVAVRDPETHFLVVPVSHTVQIVTTKTKGNGNGIKYEDVPVVSESSYRPMDASDGLTFDAFLKRFIASGSNKGLQLSLKDPRIVVPVIKALEELVASRSLQSPIVLDAEVLPGPQGFLPQMACVYKNSSAYSDSYLWGDYWDYSDSNSTGRAPSPSIPKQSMSLDAFSKAKEQDALVPFDPVGFVRTASTRLPGAILSPGVASGGIPCASVQTVSDSDADTAWSYAAEVSKNGGDAAATKLADAAVDGGFRFDNWRRVQKYMKRDKLKELEVKVFNFEDKADADDKKAAGSDDSKDTAESDRLESELVKLPKFFTAAKARHFEHRRDGLTGEVSKQGVAHRKRVKHFMDVQAKRVAATETKTEESDESDSSDSATPSPPSTPNRRKLSQMEFEVMAEAEAMQEMEREQKKWAEEQDTAAKDRAAQRLGTYDYFSETEKLVSIRTYGPEIGVEQLRLLRNASWFGDAWFPHSTCSLSAVSKFHPGYLRDLMNRRMGYSVYLRGNVLLTETLRVSLLKELDASRTVLGFDLRRLPRGEALSGTNIFVDPVVDNPELALEESEEETELEDVEKSVVGVDYGGAEEELLDEEAALWHAKVSSVAEFMKKYVHKYVGVEEEEGEEGDADEAEDDDEESEGEKPMA